MFPTMTVSLLRHNSNYGRCSQGKQRLSYHWANQRCVKAVNVIILTYVWKTEFNLRAVKTAVHWMHENRCLLNAELRRQQKLKRTPGDLVESAIIIRGRVVPRGPKFPKKLASQQMRNASGTDCTWPPAWRTGSVCTTLWHVTTNTWYILSMLAATCHVKLPSSWRTKLSTIQNMDDMTSMVHMLLCSFFSTWLINVAKAVRIKPWTLFSMHC